MRNYEGLAAEDGESGLLMIVVHIVVQLPGHQAGAFPKKGVLKVAGASCSQGSEANACPSTLPVIVLAAVA